MSTSSITLTKAVAGGSVTSDGGSVVTARGVCWDTSANPAAGGNCTTDGSGTGAFTSALSELAPGALYHVRAYATTAIGTGYSNDTIFATLIAGDMTNHGTVDMTDALKALRIAAGIDVPTAAELVHGDVAPLVNGKPQPDGKIDISDVVVILRTAVGHKLW